MCRAGRGRPCGKTTWAGCGSHVGAVKARVPTDQWCPGHADAQEPGGRFRLFGRRRDA
jgi:hypothetical protein